MCSGCDGWTGSLRPRYSQRDMVGPRSWTPTLQRLAHRNPHQQNRCLRWTWWKDSGPQALRCLQDSNMRPEPPDQKCEGQTGSDLMSRGRGHRILESGSDVLQAAPLQIRQTSAGRLGCWTETSLSTVSKHLDMCLLPAGPQRGNTGVLWT